HFSHIVAANYGAPAEDPLAPPGSSGLSRTGHSVVAVCLGFILFFGCFNNLLVLFVFARFRSLWTPINVVLLNISASDMLVCVFGTPFSFASSLYGRWLLGQHGCEWYGFANSLFGIVSLVSLSVLSYERYVAVLRATKPDTSDFRKAWRCVACTWLYSLVWTLPPFLGWSSYGPEGPGTTCSVQWHQRSTSSISYVVCLFIFCLVLPLFLMVYCYGKILLIIKGINLLSAQRRENHILLMVFTMVSCYLMCWMPYGVVSLMATFGRQGLITPVASVVPSVLAKSSTVINPVIYVLFNNQASGKFYGDTAIIMHKSLNPAVKFYTHKILRCCTDVEPYACTGFVCPTGQNKLKIKWPLCPDWCFCFTFRFVLTCYVFTHT
uniref:G-protein coupled receptors family 1 profile domain-containing protein n=1 Tax=Pygocentrus nattereri TaxID=42514 RepID=A0AAR2K133_PYGNA